MIVKMYHKHTNQWFLIGSSRITRNLFFVDAFCIKQKGHIIINMEHMTNIKPATPEDIFWCHKFNVGNKHLHEYLFWMITPANPEVNLIRS